MISWYRDIADAWREGNSLVPPDVSDRVMTLSNPSTHAGWRRRLAGLRKIHELISRALNGVEEEIKRAQRALENEETP